MRKMIAPAVICTAMFFPRSPAAYAADPYDRKFLEGCADKVLEAVIEHDPGRLMPAKDVR